MNNSDEVIGATETKGDKLISFWVNVPLNWGKTLHIRGFRTRKGWGINVPKSQWEDSLEDLNSSNLSNLLISNVEGTIKFI